MLRIGIRFFWLAWSLSPEWRLKANNAPAASRYLVSIAIRSLCIFTTIMGRIAPSHVLPRAGIVPATWFWCQAIDFTGIFTECCLPADLGKVILSTPLEKSVFTVFGSGSNGRVIDRANLPKLRS